VYLGVPEGALDNPSMFPMLVIQRVGGGQDPSEALLDRALMQVMVIGKGRDSKGCWDCASDTRDALVAIRGNTALRSNVVAWGAEVNNVTYAPDVDGRPRYAITALVTAAAA
jgi:hypothetical protein